MPANFRFHAKKVGLTYSCPVDLDDSPIPGNAELLAALEAAGGAGKYIVAQELHESGKRHYHVYFAFDKKVDTTDSRFFDAFGVHPNIIRGPGAGWQSYCKKDKEYISNLTENNWQIAMALDSADAALEHLWSTETKEMCVRGAQIEDNIRKRKRAPYEAPLYYGPWPKAYFPEYDPKTHSLLLWGPPGIGKTQFARYYLAHTVGEHGYAKRSVESLKKLDVSQPFIFDEVYLVEDDPQESREITDVENGGSLKARYGNVEIPPGVPRVFVSNYEHPFKNPQEAVYGRRVVSHAVTPQ